MNDDGHGGGILFHTSASQSQIWLLALVLSLFVGSGSVFAEEAPDAQSAELKAKLENERQIYELRLKQVLIEENIRRLKAGSPVVSDTSTAAVGLPASTGAPLQTPSTVQSSPIPSDKASVSNSPVDPKMDSSKSARKWTGRFMVRAGFASIGDLSKAVYSLSGAQVSSYDSGLGFSPRFGAEVVAEHTNGFAIATSFNWIKFKESKNPNYDGDQLMSLFLVPQIRFADPSNPKISSFIGFGLGIVGTSLAVSTGTYGGILLTFASPVWSFGFGPVLGFDIEIADGATIGLETAYEIDGTRFDVLATSGASTIIAGHADAHRQWLSSSIRLGRRF